MVQSGDHVPEQGIRLTLSVHAHILTAEIMAQRPAGMPYLIDLVDPFCAWGLAGVA